MASLLIMAGIATSEKIHKRKEAKREKKRLANEARYLELEQEHMAHESKLRKQTSEMTESQPRTNQSNPFIAESEGRRSSESEQKYDYDCDPSRWVDDVVNQKTKT
jgi:hypothetical protein